MDQLIVQMPQAAAWLLGAMFSVICAGGMWAIRKVLSRLDKADENQGNVSDETRKSLHAIRDILQTEVMRLREMHHRADVRIVKLEEWRRAREPHEQ